MGALFLTAVLACSVAHGACPDLSASSTLPVPAELDELSGLAASIAHPGHYYAHNDSGASAQFFLLTETGAVRATYELNGVEATDWEDIAVAEINGVPGVYIADTGNNSLDRDEQTILLIAEPALPTTEETVQVPLADSWRIAFPRDEDVEALAVEPGTGDFLLATRDRDGDGMTRIYRAASTNGTSTRDAVLLQSLNDPPGGFKTKAADLHRGRYYMLLQHSSNSDQARLLLWAAPIGREVSEIIAEPACVVVIDDFEQAEATTFSAGGTTILVGGEGGSDPIRRYELPHPHPDQWSVN